MILQVFTRSINIALLQQGAQKARDSFIFGQNYDSLMIFLQVFTRSIKSGTFMHSLSDSPGFASRIKVFKNACDGIGGRVQSQG